MENLIWYTFLTLYGAVGLMAGTAVTAMTLKYWKYAMEAEKAKTDPRQISFVRLGLMYATLPANFMIYLLAWPAMVLWCILRVRKAAGKLQGVITTTPES
jgi:hypothetical protein